MRIVSQRYLSCLSCIQGHSLTVPDKISTLRFAEVVFGRETFSVLFVATSIQSDRITRKYLPILRTYSRNAHHCAGGRIALSLPLQLRFSAHFQNSFPPKSSSFSDAKIVCRRERLWKSWPMAQPYNLPLSSLPVLPTDKNKEYWCVRPWCIPLTAPTFWGSVKLI